MDVLAQDDDDDEVFSRRSDEDDGVWDDLLTLVAKDAGNSMGLSSACVDLAIRLLVKQATDDFWSDFVSKTLLLFISLPSLSFNTEDKSLDLGNCCCRGLSRLTFQVDASSFEVDSFPF